MKKILFAIAAIAVLCLLAPDRALGARASDGTITTVGLSDCSDGNGVLINGRSAGSIGISVQGPFAGFLHFTASMDGAQFAEVKARPLSGGPAVSSTSSPGQWALNGANLYQICVSASEMSSGTATITFDLSPAHPAPPSADVKPAGAPPSNADIAQVVTTRDAVRVQSAGPSALLPRCNPVLRSNCQP